jgi:hypothetical protein
LTTSFVAALVLNAAVFGIEDVAVTVLRCSFPAIYEPRARFLFKANHEDIKMHNGMHAYFFVRFLHMMVHIFLPFW